jgi:ferrochelatase
MSDGSPLKVHTARQATLLRGYVGERTRFPLVVDYAMRYGRPAIADKLREFKAQNCDRILLVPLYPQYSASTTGSALAEPIARFAHTRNMPAIRTVRHFHDHPGYIGALAQNVRDYWMKSGRPDKLVMSFHGVPRFTLDRGDPYHCECQKTARLLAEALVLKPEQYVVTFQSRFGRAEWLKPYTAEVLAEFGRQHVGRVDVVCPGFVSDCLETLEEIAIEGKTVFLQAGGRDFHYIPCLNERHDWIHTLTDVVANELQGWLFSTPAELLESSRMRAMALGAKS